MVVFCSDFCWLRLDSGRGILSYFPFLSKGLHNASQAVPWGLLGWTSSYVDHLKGKKQPGPTCLVSGGAGTANVWAQERPQLQEVFLEDH